MRFSFVALFLIAAALPAADVGELPVRPRLSPEVSDAVAYVQTREYTDGGRTIIARVRIFQPGTYFLAGGWVINDAGVVKFYTGEVSKLPYYEVKVLQAEAAGVAEVVFTLPAVPPLAMAPETAQYYATRVNVYLKEEHVPIYRPVVVDRK